jgi:phosphoribosyl 1,2-cyclic phosphate phosphodiesterase
MRLTYLGTAAANAFPEAFCGCANCESARLLGGPSLRKRSAALINDDLLIDLGPDIMAAAQMHNLRLNRVSYCIQTHGHADHLDTSHFLSRSPGYGVTDAPRLHFYASGRTARHAAWLLQPDTTPDSLLDPSVGEQLNLEIHIVEALRPFNAGPYRVTGFPANHDPAMEPLLYAIESEGRCLFYGNDTGALPETTWQALRASGLRFDLVSLDHTFGFSDQKSGHMRAREVIEHFARMRADGMLAPGARLFATHIAHDCNPAHPELAAYAAQQGYEIAYDGLTIDLA